jgi:hypothetical protein
VDRAERVTAREAICAALEALAPVSPDDQEGAAIAGEAPPTPSATTRTAVDVLTEVRVLRARWQQEIASRGVDPEHARSLDARFTAAFERVVSSRPDAFAGSDLDPSTNLKRMESLVHKAEELLGTFGGARPTTEDRDEALSPSARLATLLKETLAANTMGGKIEDDGRWRAAAEDVRRFRADWTHIGPVPNAVGRPLADRFHQACRRLNDLITARLGAVAPQRPDRGRAGGPGRPDKPGESGRPGGAGRPGGDRPSGIGSY